MTRNEVENRSLENGAQGCTNYRSISLRAKLTLSLAILAIFPLLISAWIFFLSAEKALTNSTLSGLNLSAEYKEGEIFLYLETLKTNARDFASDGFIRSTLAQLPKAALSVDKLNYHLRYNKLPIQDDLLFIDVLDIRGNTVASSSTERIGLDQSKSIHYLKGRSRVYVSNVDYYSGNQLSGAVAAPLTEQDKPSSIIGVLVNHYRMDKLSDLFSGKLLLNLGAQSLYRNLSGPEAVYLVNADGRVIANSSLEPTFNVGLKINTRPVQQAQNLGLEASGIWENSQGILVAGVSNIIEIDDFRFLLLAEKSLSASYKQIEKMKIQALYISILTVLVIIIASWLLAYFITTPLKNLITSIDTVASGKFDINVQGIRSRDEIGTLAKRFNVMARRLKTMQDAYIDQNKTLQELSIRDGMTGLYNHRHLIELGDNCVAEARRYNKPLSCVMLDIDHFKLVNDTFGHKFGDFVLTEFSQILKNQLRSADIVGRYGGEEFAVIMPETSVSDGIKVAEKIRLSIERHTFIQSGVEYKITVSLGIAQYDEQESEIMDILAKSDKALYQSKANGRNRVTAA